jgi:hypothetical protein
VSRSLLWVPTSENIPFYKEKIKETIEVAIQEHMENFLLKIFDSSYMYWPIEQHMHDTNIQKVEAIHLTRLASTCANARAAWMSQFGFFYILILFRSNPFGRTSDVGATK